jgi:hypothetical protein
MSANDLRFDTVAARQVPAEGLEALLRSDANAMIYPTPGFLAFLEEAIGCDTWLATAHRGSQLAGVLPFATRTTAMGTVINSLPWYGSYGGCHLADAGDAVVREGLLREFARRARAPGVLSAQLTVRPDEVPHQATYAEALGECVEHPLRLQWNTLPDDGPDLEERLLQGYLQKTRNLVRKSLKQGFELVEADDDAAWDFLVRTHTENMQVIGGQPKPASHFQALRRHIPAPRRKLLVARHDGQPAAAMLLLLFNRTVEYVTPVIQHDFRPLQPLSFLILEGMKLCAREGFGHWNWGGTWESQATLHHFKEGFGARTIPYCYLVHGTPENVAAMKASFAAARAAFPYFYLYPFHLLEKTE